MKRTLYAKLLFSYLLFAFAGIIVVCTFTQKLTSQHLMQTESETLYREANLLAINYAANYYSNSVSRESLQQEMEAISTYLAAEIWIVDNQGAILINSADSTIEEEEFPVIEGFDIGDFGS